MLGATLRGSLALALVTFGVAAAAATQTPIETADCGEMGDTICSFEERRRCTVWGICWPYFYICCLKEEVLRSYEYYHEADPQ